MPAEERVRLRRVYGNTSTAGRPPRTPRRVEGPRRRVRLPNLEKHDRALPRLARRRARGRAAARQHRRAARRRDTARFAISASSTTNHVTTYPTTWPVSASSATAKCTSGLPNNARNEFADHGSLNARRSMAATSSTSSRRALRMARWRGGTARARCATRRRSSRGQRTSVRGLPLHLRFRESAVVRFPRRHRCGCRPRPKSPSAAAPRACGATANCSAGPTDRAACSRANAASVAARRSRRRDRS